MASARQRRTDPLNIVVSAALFGAAVAAYYAQPTRTGISLLIALCAVAIGFLMVRGLRTIGRTVEIGWLVFGFGMLFWFFVPGLEMAVARAPFRIRAAAVEATQTHFVLALAAITLFFFAFNVGYAASVSRRARAGVGRLLGARATISGKRLLILVAALFGIVVGGYLILSGGASELVRLVVAGRATDAPWQARGTLGTGLTPLHIILSSIGVAIAISCGYLILFRRVRGWWLVAAIALWIVTAIWVSLATGTRSRLLLAVAPPLVVYGRHVLANRGGRLSLNLAVAIVVVMVIGFASFLRDYRREARLQSEIELSIKDNDFLTQTALAIEVHRRERRLLKDSAVLSLLTGPIPRALWKSKPISEVVPVFSRYVWGVDILVEGGNTLPSVVGQYILAWGWFGVIAVGLSLGFLVRLGDDVFADHPAIHTRLFCAVFFLYLFVSFRYLGFNHFPTLYAMLFVLILARTRLPRRTG